MRYLTLYKFTFLALMFASIEAHFSPSSSQTLIFLHQLIFLPMCFRNPEAALNSLDWDCLSLCELRAVSVARLSHTVCCLWLQQPRFISFCLLQHNCCQYSCEIFQENELQQKLVSQSLLLLSLCLTHTHTHTETPTQCMCACMCVIGLHVILGIGLHFCHENNVMIEFYQLFGLGHLLSHMVSVSNTHCTYTALFCSTKSNITTK